MIVTYGNGGCWVLIYALLRLKLPVAPTFSSVELKKPLLFLSFFEGMRLELEMTGLIANNRHLVCVDMER